MTTRLAVKAALAVSLTSALFVMATALIVRTALEGVQADAVQAASSRLEAQVSATYRSLVSQEVRVYSERLSAIQALSEVADRLFGTAPSGSATPRLVQGERGQWYDPSPGRRSELLIPKGYAPAATLADQRDSAPLERLFPTLLAQVPEAVALYYVGVSGLTRYSPVIGLHRTQAATVRVTGQEFFTSAAPAANPARLTRWSAPYEDTAGQGRLVTLSHPVYREGNFRGVIGIDISVAALSARLEALQSDLPAGAFAFLLGRGGITVAVPDRGRAALPMMVRSGLQGVLHEVEHGTRGERVVSWDDQTWMVLYAPVAQVGWSLGLALPRSELRAATRELGGVLQSGTWRVLMGTLAVTAGAFFLALAILALLTRRLVADPLSRLLVGTDQISRGEYGTQVPVTSSDELGQLTASFNAMSRRLSQVREQERELERLHRTAARASVLIGVANSVHLKGDLRSVLADLASAVVRHTGTLGCIIAVLSDDDPWGVRASAGMPADFIREAEGLAQRGQGTPMSALAREHKRRVVVPDWPAHVLSRPELQPVYPWAERPLWRGVICTPLLAGGQVTGVVYFYLPPGHDLSEPTLALYDAVAHQVGLAVENARLIEQVRRSEREARTLSAVAAIVADPSSLESSLDAIAQRVVDVSGAQGCAVFVLGAGGTLTLAGSHGLSGDEVQTETFQAAGAAPLALEALSQRRTTVHEVARDPDEPGAWRRVVYAPMILSGRPVGTLAAYFSSPASTPLSAGTTHLIRAIADQAAVAVENAQLLQQVQSDASREERQRLARELHDSVSQALFSIALSARTARTLLGRGQPDLARPPVDHTLALAEAGIAEMRALIFELRPESLRDEGLVAALAKQAAALQARHGLRVDLELGDEPDLPLATKDALYRVAQEALHNVVKHAAASHVRVSLSPEPPLRLVVTDDGRGFDPQQAFPGHLGLKSMRERCGSVGAHLAVHSGQGGTSVCLTLPATDPQP